MEGGESLERGRGTISGCQHNGGGPGACSLPPMGTGCGLRDERLSWEFRHRWDENPVLPLEVDKAITDLSLLSEINKNKTKILELAHAFWYWSHLFW